MVKKFTHHVYTHKLLIASLVFLFVYSLALITFATPPASPYTTGQTLDPSCSPGDTNCTVGILESRDEGTNLTYQTKALNFVGSGITATEASGVVTVTVSVSGTSITADSINFTELADALTLDTSTDIAITGTNVFSLTNTGTDLSFRVNDASADTTPFVIDGSGKVGVGTSSPTVLLDVGGSYTPSVGTAVALVNGDMGVNGTLFSDTGNILSRLPSGTNMSAAIQVDASNQSGGHNYQLLAHPTTNPYLASGGSFTIYDSDTGSHRFTITSSGLVGIKDTSPDYLLELYDPTTTPAFALSDDDIAHGLTTLTETDVFSHLSSLSTTTGGVEWTSISDTNAQALSIRGIIGSTDPTDTTPAIKLIGAKSNGTTGVADLAAAETVFQVANNDDTSALTILGSGNVGINDTTPDYRLDIETDTASSYVANFFNDGNNDNRYGIIIQAGADTPSAGKWIQFNDGDGGDVGTISLVTGTLTLTTTSDQRLKENITDTTLSLETLRNIPVRDFSFISDPNKAIRHGFIAQELKAVYPDAVYAPEDPDAFWQVSYTQLTPLMIKSIQEIDMTTTAIQTLKPKTPFVDNLKTWLADIGSGIEKITTNLLKSKRVETEELCVGSVCVTEAEFLEMLQGRDSTAASPQPLQIIEVSVIESDGEIETTLPGEIDQSLDTEEAVPTEELVTNEEVPNITEVSIPPSSETVE